MIKYIFVLFLISNVNGCKSQSHAEPDSADALGIVIIDSSIEKKFFEVPPQRLGSNMGEVRINSYIRDTVKSLPLFDTCNCLLKSDDSLVMEFKSLLGFKSDTIKIKVVNDKYSAYYIKTGVHYPAVSGSLKFHHKPHQKGQEIYGELGLEFIQDEKNSTRFFKGPFRCTIE